MGERITTASVSEDSNQHKQIRTAVKQTRGDVVSIEDGREEKKPRLPGMWEIYDSALPSVARLSGIARCVYGVLCEHANETLTPSWLPDRPPGLLAWPGVDSISKEAGFSDRAVQKAIAQLLDAGVIKCVFASRGGGSSKERQRGMSNVYQVGVLPRIQKRTPNQVHRSTVNEVHPEPRRTVNEVPENGECCSPELINRTTNKEQQQQHAREARSAAVADDALFNKRLEDAKPHFGRIEQQLGQAISGKTRADLQRSIEAQGFSVAQLAYAFGLYGKTYKTVGGLISFARDLKDHAAAIEKWPCLDCYGEGIVNAPGSPFEGKLPCTCDAGQKQERRDVFEGVDEYRRDPANYCAWCRNTGKRPGMWSGEDDFCSNCKNGRQLAVQTAEEKAIREREEQRLIEAGKCAQCAGAGRRGFEGKKVRCWKCMGTGLPAQPPGSCNNCWGERTDIIGKPCRQCAGK